MSSRLGLDYWSQEGKRYWMPHARLREMARWLAAQPQRRVLDIGCSSATLKRLLPQDFDYFGCDITADAAPHLTPGHFLQCDFNRPSELDFFADRAIDAVHIGGVLEYLSDPGKLVAKVHDLVPSHAPLVVSMINFDGAFYAGGANHHLGWVYKPGLADFIQMLHTSRWHVEKIRPFMGRGEFSNAWFRLWGSALGWEHRWTRRSARQFIVLARAL